MTDCGLNLNKLYGQGYDGCATMAGQEGGVIKLIRDKYTKALFFHCSNHRLNLVINNLNKIMIIRNSTGTIKDIIRFFRESTLRRKLIPNIPLFCETCWSSKYKSIRVFTEHFISIMTSLKSLSNNEVHSNSNTRQRDHYLYSAASNSSFLIFMITMAKYSAILEPMTNMLQGVSVDLYKVSEHINSLLVLFDNHQNDADNIFQTLYNEAKSIAIDLDIVTTCPVQRTVKKQSL